VARAWPVAALLAAVAWLYAALMPWARVPAIFPWDSVDFAYPYALYANRALHAGAFPLWNPFSFAGAPFVGNLQTLAFHPPTLLAALALPDLSPRAFALVEVAQIALGAGGLYAWARARGRPRVVALAGGVVFAGSGFVVGLASHYTLLALHVLLPWPFAFLARWDRERRVRWLVACGVALALWLTASYPSLLGYQLLAFACYYAATRRARPALAEVALLAVAPLLLAGAHLVPCLARAGELTRLAPVAAADVAGGSLAPAQLASLALGGIATLPSRFGAPDVTLRDLSIGMVGCVAAAYALTRPTRGRLLAAAAVLVCALLVCGDGSALFAAWRRVSFLSARSRHPAVDFGGLLSFAAITLALDGAADLLERPIAAWRLAAALAVPCGAWWLARASGLWDARDPRFAAATLYAPAFALTALAAAVALRKLAPARTVTDAATAAASSSRWARAGAALAGAAVVAGVAVDAAANVRLNAGEVAQPFPPQHLMAAPRAPVASYFDLAAKWPRRATYPRNHSRFLLDGARADGGYDSSVLALTDAALRAPAAHAVLLAAPRAFVADEVRVAADPAAVPLLDGTRVVAAFTSDAAPALALAVAAAGAATTAGSSATAGSSGTGAVTLDADEPRRARYTVRSARGCVVVWNELDQRGWSLAIDGAPATPLRANGFFRAAALPPGVHRVEWRYWPPGFSLGLALSALGVVAFVALALLARRRGAT
jgi:hypothetical protein